MMIELEDVFYQKNGDLKLVFFTSIGVVNKVFVKETVDILPQEILIKQAFNDLVDLVMKSLLSNDSKYFNKL